MTKVSVDDLERFATDLLRAGGFAQAHARDTARVLVWADARGTASHGVLRIPRYVEMVDQTRIDPAASFKVEKVDGAICVANAGNMPGATAMLSGMREAIDIAGKLGIGWCSVKNITHAGAVGYYAMQAAERGMIGIVMSASGPLMAYHGARVSGLSTNPISIAAPKEGDPVLLDMSTSTVALGKIIHARDAGHDIPEGWAIAEDGTPATDPTKVKTLTPLGGPKGSGLSLMIELLASVIVGNPVISSALTGGKAAMNGIAMAIDVKRFGDPAQFTQQLLDLAGALKALPKAVGTEEILLPGERGFRLSKERSITGILLADGTATRLSALAERLNVTKPDGI